MTGRALPSPSQFAGDDGRADSILAAVLADFSAGRPDARALQHALVGARLLTPIVATATEVENGAYGSGAANGAVAANAAHGANGHRHEKTTELSTVTVQGRDGRRALPVFSSLDALAAWDAAARPFPVTAIDAARGVFDEGLAALLVDPGSVAGAVVEGPALVALAEARWWLEPAQDPAVVSAVHAALDGLPGLASVSVAAGREADLTVTLSLTADASAAARTVAQAAAERLAAVDVLRTRLARGLDLTVSPQPG